MPEKILNDKAVTALIAMRLFIITSLNGGHVAIDALGPATSYAHAQLFGEQNPTPSFAHPVCPNAVTVAVERV